MKNKGKSIMVFVFVLLFSTTALAADVKYKDVPNTHWAFQAIQNLSSLGIVKGFPDKSFKPDKRVTREQFAIILVNTFKFPLNKMAGQTFSDVSIKHRSLLYIDAAKSFIPVKNPKGYNFNFYPNRPITRQEVAHAIAIALDLKKAQKPVKNYLSSKYGDYLRISPEFRDSVAEATYYGIMSGDSYYNFRPQAGLNRGELCAVFDKILKSKTIIEAGFKPAHRPWTIEFVNFQRPDYEMVRDFPGYNQTQTFYGKVVSKQYGFNNSNLIVRHEGVEETDGEYSRVEGKTVYIYLTDKDLNIFHEGEWVMFSYDRDNNIIKYNKDL